MEKFEVAMAVTRRKSDQKFLSVKKAGNHESGRYAETPWEVPGGKIEDDESPEKAALRELREETGIDARLERKHESGLEHEFERGETITKIEFFPSLLETDQEVQELSEEHEDFKWIDLDEVRHVFAPHELEAFRLLGLIE
ncbi:MAG: NUDIX domain-containing protein [Candidatus Nanohaloarchaea archaeon]